MTGAVLEPYRKNAGTADNPKWVAGDSRGPAVYFPPEALATALTLLAQDGIDPHLHADGDGAVHAGLDAAETLRKRMAASNIAMR